MTKSIIKSTRLTFSEGSSDKEYVCVLENSGDDTYSVDTMYGPRGSSLKPAPKGKNLTLPEAEKLFASTVNSKTRKGYVPDTTSDNMVVAGVKERSDTGMRAQLLNPVDISEATTYLSNDSWGMQEKYDGERLLVKKTEESLVFSNRNGQETNVIPELVKSLSTLFGSCVIDGENVAGIFYAFDMLEKDNVSYTKENVLTRNILLREYLLNNQEPNIVYVPLIEGTNEKTVAFQWIKEHDREGVVFKKLDTYWSAGRPNSGGNQIKIKFWESISCIVTGVKDKNSFTVGLYENGEIIPMGSVTAKQIKPNEGNVVEIKYLYVKNKGGFLYQPEFIAIRNDILPEECTTVTIKYKNK